MTEYHTLQELQELAVHQKKEIWQIVQQEDMDASERTQEQSYEKMHQMYEAMKYADASYNGNLRSASGRAGGDGEKLHQYNASGKNICGVLPAVLLSFEEQFSATEEQMVQALYVAAGIGKVIAENAFIAGAAGGCQAEIGSAAAMSAGALAYLQGADPQTVMHAAALSLKNMLGLACDPVGGLVEVPCIKRNSYGAVNAVTSAQLALAGIRSAITPDDVIDSMRRIGNQMPTCLKETSEGGLATSASAEAY